MEPVAPKITRGRGRAKKPATTEQRPGGDGAAPASAINILDLAAKPKGEESSGSAPTAAGEGPPVTTYEDKSGAVTGGDAAEEKVKVEEKGPEKPPRSPRKKESSGKKDGKHKSKRVCQYCGEKFKTRDDCKRHKQGPTKQQTDKLAADAATLAAENGTEVPEGGVSVVPGPCKVRQKLIGIIKDRPKWEILKSHFGQDIQDFKQDQSEVRKAW